MSALTERITAYLAGGGLWNPELANHDAVRDLLIDCRDALSAPSAIEDTKRHDDLEGFIDSVNALHGVYYFPDDLELFWTRINAPKAAPPEVGEPNG